MASATRGPPGTTPTAAKTTAAPNKTLYIRNLNEKLNKDTLKCQLYMLLATYGVILDVMALKTTKMRGQAHVVFRDVDAAIQAMRALQSFDFFGKPMQIQFAKSDSATEKKLRGTYQIPGHEVPVESATGDASDGPSSFFGNVPAPNKATPVNAPPAAQPAAATEGQGTKRPRQEEESDEDEAAMDVSDSD